MLLVATSKAAVASTATVPSSNGTAFLMETVFTAIFLVVILQASLSERFGGSALLALPRTPFAIPLAAIPFSGSSVNPARTIGPDLVGNRWTGIWIYLIAPPLGAAIGWAVHKYVAAGGGARPAGAAPPGAPAGAGPEVRRRGPVPPAPREP